MIPTKCPECGLKVHYDIKIDASYCQGHWWDQKNKIWLLNKKK